MHTLLWPPQYTLRRSARAKRISLRIKSPIGLEIVVPLRARESDALYFLEQNRDWVQRHAEWLSQASAQPERVMEELPSVISLLAIQQEWQVRYEHYEQAKRVILQRVNQQLLFRGHITAFRNCLPAFRRWLLQQAEQHLSPWLLRLSHQHQLPFVRVSYRYQTSRWGSCSSDKVISLNVQLLFLSPQLVEYVLVHELCHTIELNHGPKFWKRVAEILPEYQSLRKALRAASFHSQPTWLYS